MKNYKFQFITSMIATIISFAIVIKSFDTQEKWRIIVSIIGFILFLILSIFSLINLKSSVSKEKKKQ
jgi:uncharacterized integral membrane protein